VPTSQLPGAVLGGLNYQGTWNASTNTPTLASSTGSKGHYYVVSVAGSTNLNGITDWKIGDWAVYDGTTWQKVDNTDAVSSVNGFTGAVVLTTSDVAQGTNLYFTQAAARGSVSAGTGISYNSGTGVITNSAPDQTVALTGAGTTVVTGTYPNFTITSNDSTVGTVTSVAASGGTTGLTFTGSPITTAGTLTLGGTLAVANGGTGATTLSSGYLLKGNGTSAVSASVIYDNGTNVGIGTNNPTEKLVLNSAGSVQVATKYINGNTAGVSVGAGSDGSAFVYQAAALPFIVYTNGTERARIDSSGNLLVGGTTAIGRITAFSANNGDIIGAFRCVGTGTQRGLYISADNSTGVVSLDATGSAAGTLAFKYGGTEAMRITTAGNVGIGTNAPEAHLTVSGGANSTSGAMISIYETSTGNDARLRIVQDVGAAYYDATYASGSNQHIWKIGGTERMRIDASGNVGINAVPVAGYGKSIQLSQDAAAATMLLLTQAINADDQRITLANNALPPAGGFTGTYNYTYTGASATRYEQATGTHKWYTAPTGTAGNAISFTQAMTLDASGNLGIGIAPDSKFHVDTAGIASMRIGYAGVSSNYFDANANIFRTGAGAETMRIDSSGNVSVGSTTALLGATGRGNVTINGSTDAILTFGIAGSYSGYIYSGSTKLEIDVQGARHIQLNTNGSERARIDSSGNLLVGTTTARNRLTVQGNVFSTPTLGTASGQAFFGEAAGYGMMLGTSGYGYGWIQQQRVDGSATAYDLLLQPVGGNVGIGETAPGSRLQVNGNIRVSNGTTFPTGNSLIRSIQAMSGSANQFVSSSIDFYTATFTDNGQIAFSTGLSERARIDGDGVLKLNVGGVVNTHLFNYNESGGEIQLIDSTGAGPILIDNVSGLARFYKVGSGAISMGTTGANYFQFITNGTERMRIDSSGNVLVGRSCGSGIGKLNVEGGADVTSGNVTIQAGYGLAWRGDQTRIMTPEDNVVGALINWSNGGGCRFISGTSERMRINGSGNVGINTSAPGAKLETFNDVGGVNALRLNTNFASGNYVDINPYISGVSNGGYSVSLNGVIQQVISYGGNFGIGTTAPSQRLDVSFEDTTTNRTAPVNVAAITATSQANGGPVFTGFGPALVFRSESYDGTTYAGPRVRMAINDDSISTTAGSTLAFDVTATKGAAPTEAMQINPSGNVGIGTDSPTSLSGYKALTLNAVTGTFTDYKENGTLRLRIGGDLGAAFINGSSGTLRFLTGDVDRMRIDSNGNVLVGRTSGTGAKLDVYNSGSGDATVRIGNAQNGNTTDVGKQGVTPYGATGAGEGFLYAGTSISIMADTGAGIIKFSAGGNTERMRISAPGYLEFPNSTFSRPGSTGQYIVGAANGGFYQQDGTNYYTVTTSGGSTSDATLKKDVQQLENALAKICAVRGVSFEFIEQPLSTSDCGTQIGVIAQEIEAQFPEIVVTHENGTKAVRYDRLVAPLIEAIKELTARVAQLEGN
jgi:hypothetical protein